MEKVLPKGWVETELGSVSEIVTGNTPSKSVTEYYGDDILWVKPGDFHGQKIIFKTDEKLSELGFQKSRKVPAGSILVTCIGNLGNISMASEDLATNQQINSIVIPHDKLSRKYIYYYSLTLKKWLIDNSTSTTISMVNKSVFEKAPVVFPPLAEQERIVTKLDKLFAQHEKIKAALDRIPQLLKNFRQQLLTQAVTGKLNKVSVLENKLVSDFFEVKTGATPKKGVSKYYQDATIPWIKSGEVKNTFIHDVDEFISEIAVKETNAKVFPVDTILVAMYGEGKTRGQVGWMKIEAATNQAIAALVNENLNEWTRRYIYLFCLSQYNQIRAKAEGGNQPNLNLSKIKNWEISIPQKASEQQEIVLRVESLFAKADAIEARYQTLKAKIEALPQVILHKAFKGELVEQLPSDGDAKDLLAEIIALKNESKGK